LAIRTHPAGSDSTSAIGQAEDRRVGEERPPRGDRVEPEVWRHDEPGQPAEQRLDPGWGGCRPGRQRPRPDHRARAAATHDAAAQHDPAQGVFRRRVLDGRRHPLGVSPGDQHEVGAVDPGDHRRIGGVVPRLQAAVLRLDGNAVPGELAVHDGHLCRIGRCQRCLQEDQADRIVPRARTPLDQPGEERARRGFRRGAEEHEGAGERDRQCGHGLVLG